MDLHPGTTLILAYFNFLMVPPPNHLFFTVLYSGPAFQCIHIMRVEIRCQQLLMQIRAGHGTRYNILHIRPSLAPLQNTGQHPNA